MPELWSVQPKGGFRETIREVRQFLDEGDYEAALALFGRLHPVDQGTVLIGLAHAPQLEMLTKLTPGATAEILENIEPEEAAEVSERLETTALSQILDEASPNVAADILRLLPRERSQETLASMQAARDVVPLLGYPDDTAGGLMTPDYPVVREVTTTGNALDQLRLLGAATENLSSVLVTDQESTLVGSLSLTRLALARPNTVVGEIANPDFISAHVDTDQEECARLMERYNLSQLPVVDGQGRLVGVILAQNLVDVVEEEATEDMYRMAGVAGERVFGPLRNSFRRRLPWLYINLGDRSPGRLGDQLIRILHHQSGRFGGIPTRGSRPGRDRRYPDRHPGGTQHGFGRGPRWSGPSTAGQGGSSGVDQRGAPGGCGRSLGLRVGG